MQKRSKRYYCTECNSIVMHSKAKDAHFCVCCILDDKINPIKDPVIENKLDSWISVDMMIYSDV